MRLRREEERAFPGGRRGNRHVAETWARAVSTSRHLPLTPTLEGGPNFHKRGRSERAEALSVAGWTQCPGSCCCPTHPACSPVTSRCRCRTANPDPSPILETVITLEQRRLTSQRRWESFTFFLRKTYFPTCRQRHVVLPQLRGVCGCPPQQGTSEALPP